LLGHGHGHDHGHDHGDDRLLTQRVTAKTHAG
jgi:hypothetical protein